MENQSKNVQGLKSKNGYTIKGVPERINHEFASEGCNTVPCYDAQRSQSYFMGS